MKRKALGNIKNQSMINTVWQLGCSLKVPAKTFSFDLRIIMYQNFKILKIN